MQQALLGFVNGVNKYKDKKSAVKPADFAKSVFPFVQGRIKEYLATRLNAGIRIPQYLQEPYRQYLKVVEEIKNKTGYEPTEDQVIEKLKKVWNKKTFYSQYKMSENESPELPIEGYVTVKREGSISNKEKVHVDKIKKIND